ncbi:MAG: sugar kinase [Chloroflexi bacterium CFX4]|nr:sugar kinase [Chloroflexi bacterium CFX4]MDL1924136.1 sugar kinase [Chloroflexi bacterium CFX3]
MPFEPSAPPPLLDVFTLGESMVRLTAPSPLRIEQAATFEAYVAGAETNVAVALARLGKRAAWFSRLPDTPLGRLAANFVRQYGVDVSGTLFVPEERMGLYFLERGMPPRPSRVWYDRANSAASRLKPSDLPLEQLAAARWLHLTGITPALSPSCEATCHAAISHARTHGLTFSFDVNYRSLLWSPQQARATLMPFCHAADVVFIASRDAAALFEVTGDAAQQAERLHQLWGGSVIVTDGANGAAAHAQRDAAACKAFVVQVVERVGAGDAFAAGVICRLLEGAPLSDALSFGAALAALKLSIAGDVALVTRQEVEALIATGGTALHR